MRKITILNFSGRNNGNCAAVTDHIMNAFKNTDICSYCVASIFNPCNSCDYQCLKPGNICPNLNDHQRKFMERLLESDLIYYIIPNYCGVPCANYYAFNERNVGYFNSDRSIIGKYMSLKKRFVMISNTESPAFEAVVKQQCTDEAKVVYLKSSTYNRSSIAGDLMTSPDAMDDLLTFLAADL